MQTTITELHELIAAEIGGSHAPDYVRARTGEVHASALDPSLAGRVLGWKPTMGLAGGLERTVTWLRTALKPRTAA